MNRWVFFAVCVLCAIAVGVFSVGTVQQGQTACKAANRALAAQRSVWGFLEQTVRSDWKQRPPTKTERRRTNVFFAGVKARLQPAKC